MHDEKVEPETAEGNAEERGGERTPNGPGEARPDSCCGPVVARMMKACRGSAGHGGGKTPEAGGSSIAGACGTGVAQMMKAFCGSPGGERKTANGEEPPATETCPAG